MKEKELGAIIDAVDHIERGGWYVSSCYKAAIQHGVGIKWLKEEVKKYVVGSWKR